MAESRGRIVRGIAVLLGVVMIAGGAAKLGGAPMQVVAFARWGLPAWFRALVGTFEVIGGALMIAPATAPFGSAILATIMVGALWAHAAAGEWMQLIPVAVLLTLFAVVFRRYSHHVVHLLGAAS